MFNYRTIFESIESTSITEGSNNLAEEIIRANLEPFKHFEGRSRTDAEYFRILVEVIFYSGFRAATVTAKLTKIHGHFPDYQTVANYSDEQVGKIFADSSMIRNRIKINACVKNAKVFREIVQEYGSFQNYVDNFSSSSSFENLMLLKEELEYRFDGLGRITTYHFMTEIGMPVLKPDRVISRIFKRLGLIENEEQLLKTVIQGRKFAESTGHPIRYIDIVLVAYGQVQSIEFGIERGICLEGKPSCSICGASRFCKFYSQKQQANT